jgi:hypothetical protein
MRKMWTPLYEPSSAVSRTLGPIWVAPNSPVPDTTHIQRTGEPSEFPHFAGLGARGATIASPSARISRGFPRSHLLTARGCSVWHALCCVNRVEIDSFLPRSESGGTTLPKTLPVSRGRPASLSRASYSSLWSLVPKSWSRRGCRRRAFSSLSGNDLTRDQRRESRREKPGPKTGPVAATVRSGCS